MPDMENENAPNAIGPGISLFGISASRYTATASG